MMEEFSNQEYRANDTKSASCPAAVQQLFLNSVNQQRKVRITSGHKDDLLAPFASKMTDAFDGM
jgi:hypothetical protein